MIYANIKEYFSLLFSLFIVSGCNIVTEESNVKKYFHDMCEQHQIAKIYNVIDGPVGLYIKEIETKTGKSKSEIENIKLGYEDIISVKNSYSPWYDHFLLSNKFLYLEIWSRPDEGLGNEINNTPALNLFFIDNRGSKSCKYFEETEKYRIADLKRNRKCVGKRKVEKISSNIMLFYGENIIITDDRYEIVDNYFYMRNIESNEKVSEINYVYLIDHKKNRSKVTFCKNSIVRVGEYLLMSVRNKNESK